MKRSFLIAGLLLATALSTAAFAANPQAANSAQQKPTFAAVYDRLISSVEKEVVDAADAMPEDKFNFAPPASLGEFKGVRTFAQQIKHVAESNYYFFGGSEFTDADAKAMSDSIEKLTTKADIVKALKDSFAKAHAFVDAITPENAFVQTEHGTRAGMASFGIAHVMDHYGQLVVYLRMNGIVPPASRGSM